jgi:DNA polymerase epsilon subunit 1
METIVEEWLIKKYEGVIYRIVRERKEDLKMPNHLLGHRRLFLQLCFRNVTDLLTVRRDLMPLALANGAKRSAIDAYAEVVTATESSHMDIDGPWGAEAGTSAARDKDPRDAIIDIREFDVPYYLRVAMDNEIRVGLWYTVTFNAGQPTLTQLTERVKRPDPVVMAFDIETTKAPLKFPDQAIDQVMMISYMVDGQGYLITNREIVGEDIDDFEYTPKEGYEGPFIVFNEPDEVSFGLLRRFRSANSLCFSRHPHYNASFNTSGTLSPLSWPRSTATFSIFLSCVLARRLMKLTCFWKQASLKTQKTNSRVDAAYTWTVSAG